MSRAQSNEHLQSSTLTYPRTYCNLPLDDTTKIHYIEAGSKNNPTLLLLHGFPSSSTQFRDLAPLLAQDYHILAPDFPGYGLTSVPTDYTYTFDNLAATILAFLALLHIKTYAIYIFDYGAPVGLRLALRNPDSVKAIISQNGNAYVEGFGHPFWDPIMQLWNSSNAEADRQWLKDNYLTLEATKMQYTAGFPDADLPLVNPSQYTLDFLQNEAGPVNQEHQVDLFYDYRKNVDIYPAVQEYFRRSQVPLLAVWGKGDPVFVPPGAEAFKRDLPGAVVKFVDAGHFALETKRWEIAVEILQFLKGVEF